MLTPPLSLLTPPRCSTGADATGLLSRAWKPEGGCPALCEAPACAHATQAAETLGSALAELGEAAEAATVLRHACELSPHAGHEKFMYLGQLLSGPESVAALRSGVRLLEEAGGKRCVLRGGSRLRATSSALPLAALQSAPRSLRRCARWWRESWPRRRGWRRARRSVAA